MDKNRVSGAMDKAKGAIKEEAGKAVGNTKLQSEGAADKAKGEVKQAAGKMADVARETVDRASDSFHKATK
jgi:uncharacterized protein YjbJ (UPF0337 family)